MFHGTSSRSEIVQDLEHEEQHGGEQDDGALVHRLEDRNEGPQAHHGDRRDHDGGGPDLLPGDRTELGVETPGPLSQPGNRGPLRAVDHHEEAPQQEDHHPADGEHVPAQLEEGDVLAGDLLVEAEGHRAARRAEQGDDAARTGDVRHAHEQALAELGGHVAVVVEPIDGHQQRKDRRGDRGVSHDVGQGGGHDEAPEVDPAGLLAYQHQHLVGEAFGEPGLGEDHADDDRSEDEPHRRVEELLEGQLGSRNRRRLRPPGTFPAGSGTAPGPPRW